MKGFLGIDVGSVSTNIVLIDDKNRVVEKEYTFTHGQVLDALKRSLNSIFSRLPSDTEILGTGVTGSAGELARAIVNADLYKTEIFSHAVAAAHQYPEVKTIFEIGGQDSKVIYLKNGVPERSKMNEWCGAGTGSMLDAQSARLGISVAEMGELAVKAKKVIDFRTRCGVFIESCAIDAQARGYPIEEIASALCHACAKNFISTLQIDRTKLTYPIVFQGGVAGNIGMKQALERYVGGGIEAKCELLIPEHYNVMGALGIALTTSKAYTNGKVRSGFRGLDMINKIKSRIIYSPPETQNSRNGVNGFGDTLQLSIDDQIIASF